jgi:hypothetical protein
MSTITQPASGFTVVEDPTTPKQEAIVEAILEDPDASNGDIADRVADRLGDPDERPSTSWVSRIRNEKLAEAPEPDPADVGWEDVDFRRMRQVAAVRNLDAGANPSKDDLVAALEADGVPPEAVAAIPDDDLHDADAVQAAVDNAMADDAYRAARRDDEDGDATDTTDERSDQIGDRLEGLEGTVEELVAEVREANERLARLERLAKRQYTDDLVAEVLRERADELAVEQ